MGRITALGITAPHYNVKDFADVATAIAAVPAGAKLYFPAEAGPYIPPTAAGWTLTKAIEIFSDGELPLNGNLDACFKFFTDGSGEPNGHKDSTIFTIADGVDRVYLHDFYIYGAGGTPTADGTGDGIKLVAEALTTDSIRHDRARGT